MQCVINARLTQNLTMLLMYTFIRQMAEGQTEQIIYREVKYTKIHNTNNTIADYKLI